MDFQMSEFAWHPDQSVIEHARLTEFLRFTGHKSFEDLYAYSIAEVGSFTEQVISFLKIHFERPFEQVLDLSRGPEWPRWCVGGRMNIVQSCLQHDSEAVALIAEDEAGVREQMTHGELRSAVVALAGRLRTAGIAKGDRVGMFLPMRADTIVVLLAVGWLGAVAVPLFSGYGPAAVAGRLDQTEAKALLTCDSLRLGGKQINIRASAQEALRRCSVGTKLIVLPLSGEGPSVPAVKLDPEDPLLILFSSGTTGEPKGILHSHCSFPIKAAQDMAFQMDIHPGDRISWITDLGWMMGPWLIYGALILGATVVLREGACDWPSASVLWEFTARNRLHVLGVSPSLVRRLAEQGVPDTRACDLSALRFFASSGEPWDPASWDWLFREVRSHPVPIINYSGGTEISGGILSNHPLAPMKPCGFSAPCPGIAADVVDEHGHSVLSGGGELAIRRPWIGQARGFWRSPERYLESYWSRVPGVWVHGDWAMRDPDGHWFIQGRSDDTLKVAGKRVGPAEVEAILCSHPQVSEAAVIGVPHPQKGTALVAVCVGTDEDTLAEELRELVARELGKPLRPERVCFVSALPKTRSGKIVRRAIRGAYLGESSGDLSAMEDSGALEEIRALVLKEV
jgi:acetyl-CoA synthetase